MLKRDYRTVKKAANNVLHKREQNRGKKFKDISTVASSMILTGYDHRGFVPPLPLSCRGFDPLPKLYHRGFSSSPSATLPELYPIERAITPGICPYPPLPGDAPRRENLKNIFRKISQTSFEKFRKHLSKNL